MINYWMIPRPKRKLITIPEILSAFSNISLGDVWSRERGQHISFEDQIERMSLKRKGARRDNSGSGGRTYASWLKSLGLIFEQEKTRIMHLTLAGEAILNGYSPVDILTHQIFKFQYPSPYSISINMNSRFRIHPFQFIFRLILDKEIVYLTQDEIAKFVITKAEEYTKECLATVKEDILKYRNIGKLFIKDEEFTESYHSSKGKVQSIEKTTRRLGDIANTIINWIEYTQLALRDEDGKLLTVDDREEEILNYLNRYSKFISRYEEHEYFQRKYGLDPFHEKDTRNLLASKTITEKTIYESLIRREIFGIASNEPLLDISMQVINTIAENTGIAADIVKDIAGMISINPLNVFEASYYDMALRGRDRCTEFEKATAELFEKGLDFKSEHVGHKPLHPDIFVVSVNNGCSGIIDTKAYAHYSITNDHKNRMIHNYIPRYNCEDFKFFMYIAGGFKRTINYQILEIYKQTNICGCAVSAINILKLLRKYSSGSINHDKLFNVFTLNKEWTN